MNDRPRTRLEGAGTGTLVGDRYLLSGAGAIYPDTHEATDAHGEPVLVRFLEPARAESTSELVRRAKRRPGTHEMALLDAGLDAASGRLFVVLPRSASRTLHSVLHREGPLVPLVAARLVCRAAAAVRAAHHEGVHHLRLDPTWIHLLDEGERLHVRVSGFGAPPPPLDEEQVRHYQAPEQRRAGAPVDGRADVWSLGAILYATLSGAPPFAHIGRATDHRTALASRDVPPLQESAPWIPPRLAEIVHGLLLRDVERRCPTVDELIAALDRRAAGSELRPAMLSPLGAEQRAHRAPAAAVPRQWSEVREPERAHSSENAVSDPLVGATLGSDVRLARLLGRGGMAAVYEGESRARGLVAVKVILDDRRSGLTLDASAARRFAREARVARSITHPNVVKVHDVSVDPRLARPYLVMELLRGRDLGTALKTIGALDPCVAARIFVRVCEGLEAVHREGIVHRDVKPANVFLHEMDDVIVPKICDFGLAKLVGLASESDSTGLTKTGTLLGSPRYMSPEQARDARNVNEYSDIWSLAASLHEALTGSRFWGEDRNLSDIILDISSREAPSLADRAPWLDPGLVDVVHRGLRREPRERYPSMAAFARALEPFAEGAAAIHPGDLRTARRGPSRSVPAAPQTTIAAAAASAPSPEPPPRAPSATARLTLTALGAALMVVAVVAALLLAWPGATARFAVRLPVSPARATVTVDGNPRRLEHGMLIVEGEPGEAFTITAGDGDRRVEVTVIITRTGGAMPERIVVPPPVAP